jgi:hypothetical protein
VPPLFLFVVAAAKGTRIDVRIEDDVAALQPRQHDDRDQGGHDAEDFLNRGLREHLGRDTAKQAARGGGDLEEHAEAHVDQLLAGASG